MITEKTISVPDISCDHCKSTIEGAVSELSGVEKVRVDIESKTVDLTYDEDQVSLENIVEAMVEVGYEVPG